MSFEPMYQNGEKSQFELRHKGHTALLLYKHNKGSERIYLVHTEVPEAIQNEGVGQQLVKEALDFAVQNHLKVVPLCPLVVAFLKRNPSYHGVIDEASRNNFV
ncbi:MAG: GNAT family N-acetyltransferase [Marinoscillum sp.]|uniref:GNAT family N-acetyltransferase n=1 Tax=Marinoscillum sp. TaxID=2024838 RepID=UPI0032F09F79